MSIFSIPPLGPSIGPFFDPSKKTSRNHYSHEQKENLCLTDPVVLKTDNLESQPSVRVYDRRFIDLASFIDLYRDIIRLHVDRRIFLFFQQAIVCYRTRFHFKSIGAQDQGKSESPISIVVGNGVLQLMERHATHSSTTPCLVAYDKNARAKYKAEKSKYPRPTGFVFLQGTDCYRAANATIGMPRCVNNADLEIDGRNKKSKLLKKWSVDTLNQLAEEELSPEKALISFIQEALTYIHRAKIKFLDTNKPEEYPGQTYTVWRVLSIYEERFTEFERSVQSPRFLEGFFGRTIEQNQPGLLEHHYSVIHNFPFLQSIIIQKIREFECDILNKNLKKKPIFFKAATLTLLMENCSGADKNLLITYLNFSPSDFLQALGEAEKTKFSQTLENLRKDVKKERIETFVNKILLEDVKNLHSYTYECELRGYKGKIFLPNITSKIGA